MLNDQGVILTEECESRAEKQHTTQTNRLGTCNGKPEENLDEIGRTTQSRDRPLAVDPGGGAERKDPKSPTSMCSKRMEHGQ